MVCEIQFDDALRRAISVTFYWLEAQETRGSLPELGIDRGKTGRAVYVNGLEKAGLPSDPKWAITYIDSDW